MLEVGDKVRVVSNNGALKCGDVFKILKVTDKYIAGEKLDDNDSSSSIFIGKPSMMGTVLEKIDPENSSKVSDEAKELIAKSLAKLDREILDLYDKCDELYDGLEKTYRRVDKLEEEYDKLFKALVE